jgi:hypothetical protein
MFKTEGLSIFKRDADCYDVCSNGGRVAALRSDFTEHPTTRARTMIPGTWRIRWEHHDENGRFLRDTPEAIEKLKFGTVHEAFAFYCGQVLQ